MLTNLQLNLQCGLGIKLCVSLRLETGLGSEISTWYQSWKVKRAEIYQPQNKDFAEKRRYFTKAESFGLVFQLRGSMATGLRVEDRLDGAANFSSWKERIVLLLQECELWDIVENSQTNPVTVPTDATLLAAYTKKNIKAKRIILDAIKDHVIPHVTGKSNAYEMWESRALK
jgi:hypothetical protein